MDEIELKEHAESIATHLVAEHFLVKNKLKDFPRNDLLHIIDTAPEDIKEHLLEDVDRFEELVISYFFRRLEYMKHEGFLGKKNDTYSIITDQELDEILENLEK
jgi:hypothetical protein